MHSTQHSHCLTSECGLELSNHFHDTVIALRLPFLGPIFNNVNKIFHFISIGNKGLSLDVRHYVSYGFSVDSPTLGTRITVRVGLELPFTSMRFHYYIYNV